MNMQKCVKLSGLFVRRKKLTTATIDKAIIVSKNEKALDVYHNM
jgi:hypothetical protein